VYVIVAGCFAAAMIAALARLLNRERAPDAT